VKLEAAQEWGSKLEHEYHIYRATSGIRGIPKMLWYGVEGRYNVMVLSRLGCTFEEMAQLGVLDANAVFTYAKQTVVVHTLVHLGTVLLGLLSVMQHR
jgi:hypothetical protein